MKSTLIRGKNLIDKNTLKIHQVQYNFLENIFRIRTDLKSRLGFLRLDKNERTSNFHKKTLDNIKKQLTSFHLSAYPEIEKTYIKLSHYLKLPKKNIVITAGSDLAIKNCFELFKDEKKKILSLSPTFAMVDIYAKLYRVKQIQIKYDKFLNLDHKKILKNINKNISFIIVANPNSPTGTVIKKEIFLKILKKAKSYKVPVIIDEAYYGFYKFSYIKYIKKFNNLIIIRTFSKAFGLAGLRAGFIVSNSLIAQNLYKFKPMYEINSITCIAVNELLKNNKINKEYIKKVNIGKKYLIKELNRLQINCLKTFANFIHIDLGKNRKNIIRILKKNKILAQKSPGIKGLEKYLRITLGPREDMKKVIKIIKQHG